MAKLLVGIDIGTRYTKVVELEYITKLHLVNAFLFSTPFIDGRENVQIDARPFLNEISNIIPLKRLHTAKIGINIPASSITAITVLLPHMSGKELFSAAINEAKRKMIPASGPNHIFECLFLGERLIGKMSRSEVLVIRTEDIYIQRIIELLKEADITPSLITTSSLAILNIIPKDSFDKNEDLVFVDLSASSINISVCANGKLFFNRNVVYGFQDILGDISHQLGLSEADMESSIKELGVPQVPFDPKDKVAIAEEIMRQKYETGQKPSLAEKPPINPLELRMLWQPHIDRIIHELRRSFAYYKEQSEGRRIGHIYFLGGSSQAKNLVATLTAQIGGQCQAILPFKGFTMPKDKKFEDEGTSTPIFSSATSLALTILNEGKKEAAINFLPLELKKKEIVTTRRMILLFAGVCLISFFGLASINLSLSNHSIKRSIEREEFELTRVKRITARLKDLSQRENDVRQLSFQVEEVMKGRQNFYLPLDDLAKIIPQEILLTNLTVAKGSTLTSEKAMPTGKSAGKTDESYRIQINGRIVADYEEATEIIEDFRKYLESIPYFSNIEIKPLKLEEISLQEVSKKAKDFRITLPRTRNFTLTAELSKK